VSGPVSCIKWFRQQGSVKNVTQVSAEGTERLASAAASADGRFVLTGGAKGLIVLRWLHSLQVSAADLQPARELKRQGRVCMY